jgi:hypothetical protein
MIGIENIPQVAVTIRKSRSRHDPTWILEVDRCPFCGQKHQHGGGDLRYPPLLGFRVSHCLTPGDYELTAGDEGIDLDGGHHE